MPTCRTAVVAAVILAVARGAAAQMGGPVMTAVPTERAPVVDGVVLGEEVWRGAPVASGFTQRTPDEGAAATERTEVRIVYTRDTLYVGVVCFDRSPGEIVVSGGRRDASLDNGDAFTVVLDTFRDGQNGFVFGTNPAGVEYDGQVINEGAGSGGAGFGQMSGSGAGFNLNWDGSWEVRTTVGDFGWSAELAIPFRTLRYGGSGTQTWGINFERNLRRRNELAYWAPLPRQFNLHRVSVAGTLVGLDVPAQRNLKLIPYVLREARRDYELDQPWRWRSNGGVDLKWSVTPSLTFDATVGTDFSQVEVDEQQINLNRFNLFFPEKRPFFLENAGFFTAGDPGDVELFFSRRIGIGPQGEVIPIVAGARLSGKVGPLRVGLLDMQAESVEGVTPANNFGVARLGWELPNRSAIGALFVNRQATGDGARADDHNRTFAVDGRWGIGRYALVSGYAARTETPDLVGDDRPYAGQVSARYDSPNWMLDGAVGYVGEGFNPEVGFLRRTNYTKAEELIMYRYRPANLLGFYEIRPHASHYSYWKPDGTEETRFVHVDNHWEWRNNYEVHTGVNFTRETVLEPFEIYPGIFVPVGRYDHAEGAFVAQTDEGAAVSADVSFNAGGFFGGKRVSIVPHLRVRIAERFVGDLIWSHNDVDLPVGDFVTNLARARLFFAFTSRLFFQALFQYNDRDDLWSSNVRVGWLQTANAGLYVVYNENDDTTENMWDPIVRNRSVIAKLTLVVDVL